MIMLLLAMLSVASAPLPPMASLPPAELSKLVAGVERARAHHPHQTIASCKSMEEHGEKGPCGLTRIDAVHAVIRSMQLLYATCDTKEPTNVDPLCFGASEYDLRRDHVRHFRRALHLPNISHVCEIGFNAGHGAALWLEGTDVKTLQSFDLPMNKHATGARELARAIYAPGRVTFHDGSTKATLEPFVKQVQNGELPPCDLWYIDGLHTNIQGWGPAFDMAKALGASHAGTVMIADDCTRKWPAVSNGWDMLTKQGYVNWKHMEWNWTVLPLRTSYNRTGWCAGPVIKDGVREQPMVQ